MANLENVFDERTTNHGLKALRFLNLNPCDMLPIWKKLKAYVQNQLSHTESREKNNISNSFKSSRLIRLHSGTPQKV
jgi:hypothetical protein